MNSKLSLVEIQDWKEFENLVSDYFKLIQENKENNLIDVKVYPSGEGSDGGRDILLKFRVSDSIITFDRKWVVQCKFYSQSVTKRHLADVNIPSLIHEHGANGYLLVCKNGVTSKVSEMFEKLEDNCKFGYHYTIWQGNDLIRQLGYMHGRGLINQYFPLHTEFLRKEEAKRKQL